MLKDDMSKVKAGKLNKNKKEAGKEQKADANKAGAKKGDAGSATGGVPVASADKIVAKREKASEGKAVDLAKMSEADALKMAKGLKSDAEEKGQKQDPKKYLPK